MSSSTTDDRQPVIDMNREEVHELMNDIGIDNEEIETALKP